MTGIFIDTATEMLLVGLVREEGPVTTIVKRVVTSGLNHAALILPLLREVMDEAFPGASGHRPIDVIGVALGPGSFTGLRIGLSTAKGLSEGWRSPLVGLDSLAAMAMTSPSTSFEGWIVPAIDARKKRFYVDFFQAGKHKKGPLDLSADELVSILPQNQTVVLGGYQGPLLAERLGTLPPLWVVEPITDWTEQLGNQLIAKWAAGDFLGPNTGPFYLRLSEAEENRINKV